MHVSLFFIVQLFLRTNQITLTYGIISSREVSIVNSYESCRKQSFLSLKKQGFRCKEVLISMDATYYLDNSGYWDTEFEWSFADTMLTTTFVSFKTKLSYWRDTISPRIFSVSEEWNTRWLTQPVAHNLMSMVVSEKDVSHSTSNLLLVRILADPRTLMNSNYKVKFEIVQALCVDSNLI